VYGLLFGRTQNAKFSINFWKKMAGTTRLELATSAVTEHLDLEFQGLAGAVRNTRVRNGTEGDSYCSRVVPGFARRNSETNEWTDWHRR